MDIPFPVIETIKSRHSVRTYDSKPIERSLMDKIIAYKGTLSNPFGVPVNIPEVNKAIDAGGEKLGTYGVIKGATTFFGVSVPKGPLSLLAAGYQFENLVLYITSLGLGTVWLAATFSRNKFQAAMGIPDSDYFPAISPVGYPLKTRLFEKIMRKTMGSDNRKPWKDLFFAGSFSNPLEPSEAGIYVDALEMLRLAPSATNAQPWRVLRIGDTFHFFEMHKANAREEDALIKQVDLGIGICHFDLTMQQVHNVNGRFFSEEPDDVTIPPEFHYMISWEKNE